MPAAFFAERAETRSSRAVTQARYARPVASVANELRHVPLLADLSQRQLKKLAKDFSEREFRPGFAVVRQGQMSGVGCFVIIEGEASVSVDGAEVAKLGPGDYFGELALISERARTATVTAETHLRCYTIQFWHFRAFAKNNPDVTWKLMQHLVDLLTEERSGRAGSVGPRN